MKSTECDDDGYIEEQKTVIDELKWIDDVIVKGGCCWVCGYNDDPLIIEWLIIEWHHVGGRKNGKTLVALCPNCHKKATLAQKGLDKDWTSTNDPLQRSHALKLKGWSKLLSLASQEMDKEYKELLEVDKNG